MADEPTFELKSTRQRIEAKKANLSGSTFTGVSLAVTVFNDVKLTGATIVNACMGEVRIEDANLSGAAITQANLTGASISDCTMTGMTIRRDIGYRFDRCLPERKAESRLVSRSTP